MLHARICRTVLLSPDETAAVADDVRVKMSTNSVSCSLHDVTDITSPATEVSAPCTAKDLILLAVHFDAKGKVQGGPK